MQKPDFEIVVGYNPNYSIYLGLSPLLHGAACAIAMQGATYIRVAPDDMSVQGWRDRPEGWLSSEEMRIEQERKELEEYEDVKRTIQNSKPLPSNPSIFARIRGASYYNAKT